MSTALPFLFLKYSRACRTRDQLAPLARSKGERAERGGVEPMGLVASVTPANRPTPPLLGWSWPFPEVSY